MSRISRDILVGAVVRVRAMGLRQKEQLAGELYRAQRSIWTM
jgi:hypothetical protein